MLLNLKLYNVCFNVFLPLLGTYKRTNVSTLCFSVEDRKDVTEVNNETKYQSVQPLNDGQMSGMIVYFKLMALLKCALMMVKCLLIMVK